MKPEAGQQNNDVNIERTEILERLESWLETPMIVLGLRESACNHSINAREIC
jgi:hypothetical protein